MPQSPTCGHVTSPSSAYRAVRWTSCWPIASGWVADKSGIYNYREATWLAEELPGLSTFIKDDDGNVFHTYSTFSRGLDPLNATYQMLDLVPKGRDEDDLEFTMGWLRRHDEY